ncbi:S-layer protein domain-containing protein [uncultured Methanolobus sp.]|uniref:S-layer protein domain-containing protein n=1 Tax=uncultured Methanolobus sp. TaxID=218300 RepID=UPI0037491AF6
MILHSKRTCNIIIAFLLFFSIITLACAESLLINEYNQPLIIREHSEPLLINGTGIFLTTGDSWDFYQGYVLTIKSVNIEQKQVWIKLQHEDELLKEAILSEDATFVYAKDDEILNITVDTIYASPGGELVTFKPVYQYQDSDFPEPIISDDDDNIKQSTDNQIPENSTTNQTNGFTLFHTIACISILLVCRRIVN